MALCDFSDDSRKEQQTPLDFEDRYKKSKNSKHTKLSRNLFSDIQNGNFEAVKKAIINHPYLAESIDKTTGMTPLLYSAGLGAYKTFNFLINLSTIDVHAEDNSRRTLIDLARYSGNSKISEIAYEKYYSHFDDINSTQSESATNVIQLFPKKR